MVMVELKGLHTVKAKGKFYYYAWRGGPAIKGEPGTPALGFSNWQGPNFPVPRSARSSTVS